ncbi:uncharacterized protein B0H18DRAFT_1017769 [Fomitopsis serialis]|uniref:uncharacterized protein n=1 Tax=Fomitopsis serialis TaxID=139415 RepID=UPI002007AAC6|nr:uncharacterized protein B0H18DRAFT_1017769 [Neoantrodia serialis]KAH9922484.1 hypothetical protein B0H18DRAFT_1017769 [Neoantrodia serialis]
MAGPHMTQEITAEQARQYELNAIKVGQPLAIPFSLQPATAQSTNARTIPAPAPGVIGAAVVHHPQLVVIQGTPGTLVPAKRTGADEPTSETKKAKSKASATNSTKKGKKRASSSAGKSKGATGKSQDTAIAVESQVSEDASSSEDDDDEPDDTPDNDSDEDAPVLVKAKRGKSSSANGKQAGLTSGGGTVTEQALAFEQLRLSMHAANCTIQAATADLAIRYTNLQSQLSNSATNRVATLARATRDHLKSLVLAQQLGMRIPELKLPPIADPVAPDLTGLLGNMTPYTSTWFDLGGARPSANAEVTAPAPRYLAASTLPGGSGAGDAGPSSSDSLQG